METTSLRPPPYYVHLSALKDSWQQGLLVLMYHSVDVPPLFHRHRGLYVSPRHLAGQLHELQVVGNLGFSTLGEWNQARPSGRQVALTFDDAYHSLFVNGLPVLQQLGARAITYVVASLIGKSNEWDHGSGVRREKLMDRAQIQEWMRCGHEIGSHCVTHRDLTTLSHHEARREIVDSKKMLEDDFGQPVRHFCYPYGAFNGTIRDIVQEAGYETATTTIPGFNTAATDALTLQRFLARHQRPWLTAVTRGIL